MPVAGDEVRKAFLAPSRRCLRGRNRQHEIANFRGRIPDANIWCPQAAQNRKISEHAAGILSPPWSDRARICTRTGGSPRHGPRIARAQRTHDHVVERRGVLDGHDVLTLTSGIAEFARSRGVASLRRRGRDRAGSAHARATHGAAPFSAVRPWSRRFRPGDRAQPDRHSLFSVRMVSSARTRSSVLGQFRMVVIVVVVVGHGLKG